ncbi:protein kinase domain-containing protein [Candidatus Ferrigenium straubiae]|jgi:serine/threonine protein kinase|uniref:protein kinase domain-containing protein n=1 Tax=Candidatus Ferrigenium straubiae TaxID=2919506 RepID=UPI003F4AB97C
MPVSLPYRLGKYELTRQIGEGATGKVYYALDTFSGREVAVKLIDPNVLADPEFNEECRRQFLNEAALAGRLAHPHIAAILEASVTEDVGYVVMEYVPEGNLSRYTFRDTLLPVSEVLQIIFKCCGALDYAFRHGIIHRDIKPANIMVVSGSNVKIADFGIAVFYQTQVSQKVTVGTPSYMSPEQLGGHRLPHLSDMYSLGIVAYELLTGRLPFYGRDLLELFDAITKQEPPPPSAHRPELPAKLDRMVMKMIAKNPADRYPSWTDLALDIAGTGRFSKFQQDFSDSDKFKMLRESESLHEFSDPEIWELVQASVWAMLPARTVILREDEPGRSMYFLASGQMKVTKQGRLLNVIKAGEYFGEMAYIMRGTKRQATLEALSDVVVAELPFPALEQLSTGCELRFTKTLLLSMTDRLMLADDRIVRMHG